MTSFLDTDLDKKENRIPTFDKYDSVHLNSPYAFSSQQ